MTKEIKSAVSRCFKCRHLIVRPHSKWGNSYTCGKNWFGGCSTPSGYSIRLCSETKDFELKKDNSQLALF